MTRNGCDPLLPEEENVAQIVEAPTEEEMNSAITRNVSHLMAVVCTMSLYSFSITLETADV